MMFLDAFLVALATAINRFSLGFTITTGVLTALHVWGVAVVKPPNFSDAAAFRAWLASPEYAAQIKALTGSPSKPREEWPVNYGELIDQQNAHATMCLEAAARHAREAERLALLSAHPSGAIPAP
jgi:hypothetical protein